MHTLPEISLDQRTYIAGLFQDKRIRNKKLREYLHLSDVKYYQTSQIEDINVILNNSVNSEEAKKYGITYTPFTVVKYMYEKVLGNDVSANTILTHKIGDLSAGNGVFFVALIVLLKEKTNFSVKYFIEEKLFAYELFDESTQWFKLILMLITEYYGEDSTSLHINIFVGDTIQYFLSRNIEFDFDLIVGNPPYVKQQNIDKETRNILTTNFTSIEANYNMYYAFIEMALSVVKDTGRTLLLVPNYLLKIKSAQSLRKLLLTDNSLERIIDFQSTKLFDDIDTYSIILQTKSNSSYLNYKILNSLDDKNESNVPWTSVTSRNINSETINLLTNDEQIFIDHIAEQPNELVISTGIATLKDRAYLIDYVEDGKFIKLYDGKKYEIDSRYVVPITKGSTNSKTESTDLNTMKFIIYPYKLICGQATLVPLNEIRENDPTLYEYFNTIRDVLETRSGSYSEENWHQFGRSQALSRFDSKIVFPTNSDIPKFRFISEWSLFYNGYAVFGLKNIEATDSLLHALTVILNSSITKKFMLLTSYYIGGGYVSYQKKYLEKFRIPELTPQSVVKLIDIRDASRDIIDSFVADLYGFKK